MSELALMKEWYRYNADVRELYLEELFQIPERARLKDRGASFPTIQDIFVHVLDAYRWWFESVVQDHAAGFKSIPTKDLTLAKARQYVRDTNRLVFGYLGRIRESDLRKVIVVHYEQQGKKKTFRIPTRDMIWHMAEEELQHRGEMNALLWQMRREPPICGWDDSLPKIRAQMRKRRRSK